VNRGMRFERGSCPFCGYDLAGLPSGICPECGRPVYRFTDRARQTMVEANQHAIRMLRGDLAQSQKRRWWYPPGVPPKAIRSFHVLLGIISGPQGIGYHSILHCGTDPANLRRDLLQRLPREQTVEVTSDIRLPLGRSAVEMVNLAIDSATKLGHTWVGTEHLLLALCIDGDRASRKALTCNGVTAERVRAYIISNIAAMKSQNVSPEYP